MEAKLVFFLKDGKRKAIPLKSATTVIGRRDDCDLRIPLVGVSRRHCELTMDKGKLVAKDLASSNGTFVNDQRVNQQQLKPGDRLAVGPVMFIVQIDGMPADIKPRKAVPAGEEVAVELDPESDEFAELLMDDKDSDEDPISALEALAEEHEEPKKD